MSKAVEALVEKVAAALNGGTPYTNQYVRQMRLREATLALSEITHADIDAWRSAMGSPVTDDANYAAYQRGDI